MRSTGVYTYALFGLTIRSDLACPELPAGAAPSPAGEVEIACGATPAALAQPRTVGVLYQAQAGQYVLRVPGVGRFLALEGQRIIVEPAPQGDAATVRLFLLGPVLAALLLQRGLVVLNASAVVTPHGRAIAIAGPPLSGKSGLAASLARQGCAWLTDELCVIAWDAEARPMLLPGFPQVKLWRDQLASLGIPPDPCARVRPGLERYRLHWPAAFAAQAAPVHAVYWLGGHPNWSTVPCAACTPAEAYVVMTGATYHSQLLSALGVQVAHFRALSALVPRVRCVRVLPSPATSFVEAFVHDVVSGEAG